MNRKNFFMSLAALLIAPQNIEVGLVKPKLVRRGRVVVHKYITGRWHYPAESKPIYVDINDKLRNESLL